jgi:hypothetical protein
MVLPFAHYGTESYVQRFCSTSTSIRTRSSVNTFNRRLALCSEQTPCMSFSDTEWTSAWKGTHSNCAGFTEFAEWLKNLLS